MTYDEMLFLTVESNLRFCGMLFCIFLVVAFLTFILKRVTKKGVTALSFMLLSILLLFGWQVAPTLLDIAGEDYVIVEGTINKLSGTGTVGNGVYHGGAYIVTEDGEEIQIQFSPGMSSGFPNSEFYATVVYARRSHYLLDIYPNMTIEEALSTSDILKEYKDDLIYYEQGA